MTANEREELIAESKHIRLVRRGEWEYAERPRIGGIVGVIALTGEGRLLLVEQYRIPVQAPVIELPAGLAGDTPACHGEALADAARRELLEETGYAAEEMTFLIDGPPSAGMTNEVMSLFLAEGLTKVSQGGGEGGEDIRVHEVPLVKVPDWLLEQRRQGRLIDLRIYTALWFLTNC